MGNIKEDKVRLEYLWLDGYTPANLRSKAKVVEIPLEAEKWEAPEWSFDGSSTKQAEGGDSDCVLKPKSIYPNPMDDGFIVFCELYLPNGEPHPSNTRAK